jgi:hypothetical protein
LVFLRCDDIARRNRKDDPMTASRCFACLRGGALALVAAMASQAAAHAQEDSALVIELNKMEDTAQGCLSSFLFDNRTGHQLRRFQIDLVFFDPNGIATKQLLLDMAPLYEDKKTFASFLLNETACAKIGSILVNDVPTCANGSGNEVDCIDLLKVSSRSEVPLER